MDTDWSLGTRAAACLAAWKGTYDICSFSWSMELGIDVGVLERALQEKKKGPSGASGRLPVGGGQQKGDRQT